MQAMTKQRHMDMLNGPLWSKLPRYALPVAATGMTAMAAMAVTTTSVALASTAAASAPASRG